MNRFAFTNIDDSITQADRIRVMTPKVGGPRERGKRPTGYDKRAGIHLEKRLRGYQSTYDSLPAPDKTSITRPGSMKRNKRK